MPSNVSHGQQILKINFSQAGIKLTFLFSILKIKMLFPHTSQSRLRLQSSFRGAYFKTCKNSKNIQVVLRYEESFESYIFHIHL